MIRIGTRGSELALWQADYAASLIGKDRTEIKIIKTKGDKIQNVSFDKIEGRAFFTKEIEEALLSNEIDIAVHSMKDLPTDETNGLTIAAVLKREDPSDILLIRAACYNENNFLKLYEKAVVGTSSQRRRAQIKNAMNSLKVEPLRGNVPTRIEKLNRGEFDAIIIARAGVVRLNIDIEKFRSLILPFSFFLPAPSQGALAVQVRDNDDEMKKLAGSLNHAETRIAVTAERSFLKYFGGGCSIPLAALAYIEGGSIHLTGSITSVNGEKFIRESLSGSDPELLGKELAMLLKRNGADELL